MMMRNWRTLFQLIAPASLKSPIKFSARARNHGMCTWQRLISKMAYTETMCFTSSRCCMIRSETCMLFSPVGAESAKTGWIRGHHSIKLMRQRRNSPLFSSKRLEMTLTIFQSLNVYQRNTSLRKSTMFLWLTKTILRPLISINVQNRHWRRIKDSSLKKLLTSRCTKKRFQILELTKTYFQYLA